MEEERLHCSWWWLSIFDRSAYSGRTPSTSASCWSIRFSPFVSMNTSYANYASLMSMFRSNRTNPKEFKSCQSHQGGTSDTKRGQSRPGLANGVNTWLDLTPSPWWDKAFELKWTRTNFGLPVWFGCYDTDDGDLTPPPELSCICACRWLMPRR